jgi:serine protease
MLFTLPEEDKMMRANLIRTRLSFLLVCIAIACITAAAWAANLSEQMSVPYGKASAVAGEVLVKFRPGVSASQIEALNGRHGSRILSASRHGKFMRLSVPAGRTIRQMIDTYQASPLVEYAEPNYVAHALMVPNDTYYSYQWNFDDQVTGGNPYGGANGGGINLEPAWDLATGAGVIVAVVDTGVAYEDYGEGSGKAKKRYYQAPDLAGTAFVAGYDFVNGDSHPNDDESHGTHVAGSIAQSTNNALGVAGIAFDCAIMPVKVLGKNGTGSYADIADGIRFAADNGANVINLSLGGTAPSTTLEQALAYAYQAGVVIVCAAGNEGDGLNLPNYPAAYDAYCIAVGGTRYDEAVAYYSNTGSYVDIAAPGGDMTADQNGDGYGDGILQNTFNPSSQNTSDFGYWFFEGTSMATAHISGAAALLISAGVSDPDTVRSLLESTAEDKGPAGWDAAYGWGIVDAKAALDAVVIEPPTPVTMYVTAINMSLMTKGRSGNASALAAVHVADEHGGPVGGAVVSGHWEQATSDSDSGTTSSSGDLALQSDTVKRASSGTTYVFVVDSVIKGSNLYDASGSVTQGSISMP